MRSFVLGCAVICGLVGGLVGSAVRAEAKTPPKPPATLIVTASLGSDATLDGLKPFLDQMKPGMSAMLTGNMVRMQLATIVGAQSLDGLDGTAATYILITDDGTDVGRAVLGKVRDEKALLDGAGSARVSVQRGWAVIGPKAVVDQVATFAFATIAPQPTGTQLSATIYVPNALARYKTKIEAGRASMLAGMAQGAGGSADVTAMMTAYIDGLFSMVQDTDRAVVTLDLGKDLAAFDLALVPRPRSRLAAFVAVQHASDFSLVGKLPAAPASILAAGRFASGPYRQGLLDAMGTLYGRGGAPQLVAAMGTVMKAATGEFAMTMSMGGGKPMQMAQVFGLADRAAADKAIDTALAVKGGFSFETMNITTTLTGLSGTTNHDGVTIKGYDVTYDVSKANAAARASLQATVPTGTASVRIGTFDALGLLTMSSDINAAIDAARGKAPAFTPSGANADFLASARSHQDSVMFVMDLNMLGKLPGGSLPFAFSLGFVDHSAHMRFAMPTSVIKAFANKP